MKILEHALMSNSKAKTEELSLLDILNSYDEINSKNKCNLYIECTDLPKD